MTLAIQERYAGINNVDEELRRTKIEFIEDGIVLSGDLTSCRNFRISKDGIIQTRNGMTKVASPLSGHSLYTDVTEDICLFVDGQYLKLLNSDYSLTILYSGLTTGLEMRYTEFKPQNISAKQYKYIFMGNGKEMLKYDGSTVTTWGDTSNLSADFEYPQLKYRPPYPSNIIMAHYNRIYLGYGNMVFYSEALEPEKFRSANLLPFTETITAISRDIGHLYIHTYNKTYVLTGRSISDFEQTGIYEFPIGAIKQRVICPHEFQVPYPIWMSKRGWARAVEGRIEYIDFDNFRLDLPETAIAYTGYNTINREILCTIKQ
jgi:hypothetical protein